jgi:ferredoxin-NADP reductase
METLRVRVAAIRAETPAIRSLRLVAIETPLPSFTPGAHIRVRAERHGELAVRAYSLVNDPIVYDRYEIAVLRTDRGGVSDWLHSVEIGQELTIEPPRNQFALAPHATEHLLIGGGIGLTPLLSMGAQLARERARFTLWALVRSPDRLPFADRLAALPSGTARIHASGLSGRCDLSGLLAGAEAHRHVYVCGPRSLIEAVHDAADATGVPAAHVHQELFDNGVDVHNDRAFDVELRGSGIRFRVEPGQTILERAEEAGMFVSYDCRRGECGTCLTRVLEGVPDHRDAVQTPWEKAANEFMTICCSRALTGKLVLDL